MILYTGQTRSEALIETLARLGIGEVVGPRDGWPPRRGPYFGENGAFADWQAGRAFDEALFMAHVERMTTYRAPIRLPEFIPLPDVVGKGAESLRVSLAWVDRLRGHGVPLYLVVQNGMGDEVRRFRGSFDGIFVGGTLRWKLRTARGWVELAHDMGIPCHIGRMGTESRLRAAIEMGADSVDSCTPLWSRSNLEAWMRAFVYTGQEPLPLLTIGGAGFMENASGWDPRWVPPRRKKKSKPGQGGLFE